MSVYSTVSSGALSAGGSSEMDGKWSLSGRGAVAQDTDRVEGGEFAQLSAPAEPGEGRPSPAEPGDLCRGKPVSGASSAQFCESPYF